MAQVAGTRERSTSGVVAASLTPVDSQGQADTAMLAEHCRGLLESGCSSIVLLGTTGEANSFALRERKAILEGVLECGVAPERLIVGTGCCACADSIELTRHALAHDVRRVLALPPFYYKQVSDDGIFASYSSVVEGANDDQLRLYVYAIPQLSGVAIGAPLMRRLMEAYPEQIAGLKDSSGRIDDTLALCRVFGGSLEVLVGNETFLLPALSAGASGCVTATANVNAKNIVALLRSHFNETSRQHGDNDASRLNEAVTATRASFERYPMIPALKAYLAAVTAKPQWRNVRPPLCALSTSETQRLVASLESATL